MIVCCWLVGGVSGRGQLLRGIYDLVAKEAAFSPIQNTLDRFVLFFS